MKYLPEGASRFDYIHGDEDDMLIGNEYGFDIPTEEVTTEYKDSIEKGLDKYGKFIFSEDSFEEDYVYSAEHIARVNSVIDGLFKR